MKQRILLAALAVLTLATPAAAEPLRVAQAGLPLLPPHEIVTIVRSTGFDPLDRPVRRGLNYMMRAVDERDREVTLLISARTGKIVSVTPVTAASRLPPPEVARRGVAVEPYERMPPGYVPPPGRPGVYGAAPPVIDEDDDVPSGYAPRPPAPIPGAMARPGYAARPPAGAMPPDDADAPPPSEPRVITSTAPDRNVAPSSGGVLPPPPERFPQRAVAPAPVKSKPPVKKTAAAPKQAPLPKPKPQANVEAAPPPPLPAIERVAPPPPAAPAAKPDDPLPN